MSRADMFVTLACLAVVAACIVGCSSVTAQSTPPTPGQATLNWTAPTTNVDGSPITNPLTFNVYWLSALPSGTLTKGSGTLIASAVNGNSYVAANLNSGQNCFYVTAVEAEGGLAYESAPSNGVCGTVAVGVNNQPSAPSGLTLKIG